MDSIYKRYLKILGVSKKKPSLNALTEIVRAYLYKIPFENISKIYYLTNSGLKYIPDFELYIEGITNNKFGGTCYANNYYLHKLLKHLGYDVWLCGADMKDPDFHIVNVVNIAGRKYVIDVGFACPLLDPIPLDLTMDYQIALGADKCILVPRNEKGYSEMRLYREGKFKTGYMIKAYARSISEFETAITKTFDKTSTFLNSILLTRFELNSSIMIHNFSVIEGNRMSYEKKNIKNKSELTEQIVKHFAIPREIIKETLDVIADFEPLD